MYGYRYPYQYHGHYNIPLIYKPLSWLSQLPSDITMPIVIAVVVIIVNTAASLTILIVIRIVRAPLIEIMKLTATPVARDCCFHAGMLEHPRRPR